MLIAAVPKSIAATPSGQQERKKESSLLGEGTFGGVMDALDKAMNIMLEEKLPHVNVVTKSKTFRKPANVPPPGGLLLRLTVLDKPTNNAVVTTAKK
jgi:hypothetical protein